MESEKSHIELPGNIIHTIIVQPGATGDWHFSSFQNESSVCDNHLCEHSLARVCILNDLSQLRCCGKYYPQGFSCTDPTVTEHGPPL